MDQGSSPRRPNFRTGARDARARSSDRRGIVGLTAAFELARRGVDVEMFGTPRGPGPVAPTCRRHDLALVRTAGGRNRSSPNWGSKRSISGRRRSRSRSSREASSWRRRDRSRREELRETDVRIRGMRRATHRRNRAGPGRPLSYGLYFPERSASEPREADRRARRRAGRHGEREAAFSTEADASRAKGFDWTSIAAAFRPSAIFPTCAG